jgi:autotransporter-associated beta strand protein
MALTKRGSGTLTLSTGTNAYSGPTTLEAGVLSIGRVADAGVTGAISGANTGTTGTIASTAGIQVGMNIFGISNGLAGAAGYSGTVTAVTSATTFTVSNAWTGNGSNLSVLFGFYSPLGISTTSTSNLVFNGGSLRYSGSAGATNRLFSIGTGGGGIIADGTTGQLVFSGTGTVGFNGQTGAREFTLSGTNTGTNTLNVVLADNAVGQATSLTKAGTGRWVLGGINTYTGTTRIESGTLVLGAGGSIGSSRRVIVGTAANSSSRLVVTDASYTFNGVQTLMGSGTVEGSGGTITIGGTLAPGNNSPGLLTFDNTSVVLSSTANTIMEIQGDTRGTLYDAIDILGTGDLTYGGTLTLDFSQVFTSGTFNLFRFDTSSGLFANVVATGSMVGTFTNSGSGVWTATAGQQQLTFRQQVDVGGTNYGQLVIVPEPLMLGLLGIASGVAVVGIRHVRRRRQSGGSGDAS